MAFKLSKRDRLFWASYARFLDFLSQNLTVIQAASAGFGTSTTGYWRKHVDTTISTGAAPFQSYSGYAIGHRPRIGAVLQTGVDTSVTTEYKRGLRFKLVEAAHILAQTVVGVCRDAQATTPNVLNINLIGIFDLTRSDIAAKTDNDLSAFCQMVLQITNAPAPTLPNYTTLTTLTTSLSALGVPAARAAFQLNVTEFNSIRNAPLTQLVGNNVTKSLVNQWLKDAGRSSKELLQILQPLKITNLRAIVLEAEILYNYRNNHTYQTQFSGVVSLSDIDGNDTPAMGAVVTVSTYVPDQEINIESGNPIPAGTSLTGVIVAHSQAVTGQDGGYTLSPPIGNVIVEVTYPGYETISYYYRVKRGTKLQLPFILSPTMVV